MARIFPIFEQLFDDNGDPLASGVVTFYENTDYSTKKITYSDAGLNDENPNPVTLNGEGRLPFDVFGDGVYSVELRTKDNVQINLLDNVGGQSGSRSAFSDWNSTILYGIPAFVVSPDNGLYYRSLTENNLGNNPIEDAGDNSFWEEFKLRGVWNNKITYSIADVVQTTGGNLWKALTATAGNDPSADTGVNWLPAINQLPTDIATATNLVAGKSYTSTATASHVVPAASGGAPIKITWLDGTIMTLTSVSNISVTTSTKITDTTWVFQNFIQTLTLIDNGTEWEIK